MNCGKGKLQRLLLVVVKFAQLCRVHSQLPLHLHLSVRQLVQSPRINPRLHFRI